MTITSPTVNYTQGFGSAWEGPLQTTPGDPSKSEEKSLEQYLPKKKVDGTEKFVKTSKVDQKKATRVTASSLYASASISSNRISDSDGNVYKHEDEGWSHYDDGNWNTMQAIARDQPVEPRPQPKPEVQYRRGYVPAHKQTLSRSELDRQNMARNEGMDQYSKYRMKQEAREQ